MVSASLDVERLSRVFRVLGFYGFQGFQGFAGSFHIAFTEAQQKNFEARAGPWIFIILCSNHISTCENTNPQGHMG